MAFKTPARFCWGESPGTGSARADTAKERMIAVFVKNILAGWMEPSLYALPERKGLECKKRRQLGCVPKEEYSQGRKRMVLLKETSTQEIDIQSFLDHYGGREEEADL